jgi:hypothetical protein
MFGVDAGLLSRQYKLHLSNFLDWKEEKYNSEFMLFKRKHPKSAVFSKWTN